MIDLCAFDFNLPYFFNHRNIVGIKQAYFNQTSTQNSRFINGLQWEPNSSRSCSNGFKGFRTM